VTAGQPELAGFAERLLSVIDDGRRTATYKLAVLLALMDCCAEAVSPSGLAPTTIRTRALARKVAALYWPQLRPFPEHGTLRQFTNKSATIMAALDAAFRARPAVSTWAQAERLLPASQAGQVLDKVELTVARYPLVRLQTVDGVSRPFLFDVAWGENVRIPQLRAGAVVQLRPGAGDHLIRLAPLLRPLIELHWVRMVAGLNKLAVVENDLRAHLFGAERAVFPPVLRHGLLEMQHGGCFYCDRPLSQVSAVDHFIPWSRWPNDDVENLVIAHADCNGRKSNHLPGLVPLKRWADRLDERGDQLSALAVASRWRSDRSRTLSVARSVYAHLPAGAPVWEGPERIGSAEAPALLGLLSRL
jgi:5-methylcytosine-specific restriction endonuclease McrA